MPRILAICTLAVTVVSAQEVAPGVARSPATLLDADPIALTSPVDSNSPVIWDLSEGVPRVFVMTSVNGRPNIASGESLLALGEAEPVELTPWPGGGVWMESVVVDEGGVWYGVYHNEVPPLVCGETPGKMYARLGAARSEDQGRTWRNLGILLEPSPDSFDCDTPNAYFVGGYGDATVLLDRRRRDLYIFFSQYGRDPAEQGVAVARLAWADRDAPEGKVTVWNDGAWLASRLVARGTGFDTDRTQSWDVPNASALFSTALPWHDDDGQVDAFWGPSVHYNAYLQQYVMLLNRATDEGFGPGGIYIAYSRRLDDPSAWTAPVKLLDDPGWYPQVIGVSHGSGTDKLAGQLARLFIAGRSTHVIRFQR